MCGLDAARLALGMTGTTTRCWRRFGRLLRTSCGQGVRVLVWVLLRLWQREKPFMVGVVGRRWVARRVARVLLFLCGHASVWVWEVEESAADVCDLCDHLADMEREVG